MATISSSANWRADQCCPRAALCGLVRATRAATKGAVVRSKAQFLVDCPILKTTATLGEEKGIEFPSGAGAGGGAPLVEHSDPLYRVGNRGREAKELAPGCSSE